MIALLSAVAPIGRYMIRETTPQRRHTWRQKVVIRTGEGSHTFYIDFGEYSDGRLAEVFISARKEGTFVRGVLDTLARSMSLALQSGTSPKALARMLRGMNYPPQGEVVAQGSTVTQCSSIADYIGQEIEASYGDDGKRKG